MAAKRLLDESAGSDMDKASQKRMRTRHSLASVIGEVVVGNFMQSFSSVLEPMLRRVVNEEVTNGLRRSTRYLTRSPSLRIQAHEPSTLKLIFSKTLSIPIFTGSKIVDTENNPLQIILVDTRGGDQMAPTTLPHPIKIEIVVVEGDFPRGDTWTSEEFDRNIVKERSGKRPLLTGELHFTMREGFVTIGDVEFTDNSSWIRSRKFRIGARIARGSNRDISVREAITEPFVVKDHRGELYKKHHPPRLEDEVWRLEKIGKDGAFHNKLSSNGIHSVQDFLKLSIVDRSKLRKILAFGMSEKMWEVTLKHARTCDLGNKLYVFRGPNYSIIMNPICQVVKAVINGQSYTNQDLPSGIKANIGSLVRDAYLNWNSLQEVDGVLNETPLLTQGDLVDQQPNDHQISTRSDQQRAFLNAQSIEAIHTPKNDWGLSSAYICASPVESGFRYNFSTESSSSDGNFTPPAKSFLYKN